MDTPFIYNRPVTGRYFVGRRTERHALGNLLGAGENVVLYETPKTGISSLLQQVFSNMKASSGQFAVATVSLMSVRTVEDFCLRLCSAIIKSCAPAPADCASLVSSCLTGTHFVPAGQGQEECVVSLDGYADDADIRAAATLPYRVSACCGRRIFVCLDDFHSVMLTGEGERICGIMQEAFISRSPEDRASACYIFCGSAYNAMKEIFSRRCLFHRQVEHLALGEIDAREIVDSINRGFLTSGKVMDRDLMLGVCKVLKNNIFYVNAFVSLCDSLSKGYMTESVMSEALSDLLALHEPRFKAMMADLTTFQVNLLKALLDGHSKFSSAALIRRYGLNSSANVRRLKDALCKKEIITFDEGDVPRMLDPLFEYWLRKFYFGERQ